MLISKCLMCPERITDAVHGETSRDDDFRNVLNVMAALRGGGGGCDRNLASFDANKPGVFFDYWKGNTWV